MHKSQLKESWKYFICGLLLILPFSSTFETLDEINGEWQNNYVFNTFEYAVVIFPIIILLILIPRLENRFTKKILIIVLILFSGLSFWFAIQTALLPIQDFLPNWGIGLLFILFPIVMIDSFIEWKRTTNN